MQPNASCSACPHACLWTGTDQCLIRQLSAEHLATRRISLGMRCGLKALYDPHPLPPCVQVDGELCWQTDGQPAVPMEWDD